MDYSIPPLTDRAVGDELAECLRRFLAATADERTMERAREALARWHQQANEFVVQL